MPAVDEVILVDSFDHLDGATAAYKACSYPGNGFVAGRTGNCILNVQFLPYVKSFCRESTICAAVAYKSPLPGGGGQVMVLGNALSAISVGVNVLADGRLQIYDQASACPCVSKDTWYHIAVYASHSNGTGTDGSLLLRGYVNEELVFAQTFSGLAKRVEEGFTMCSLGGFATSGLNAFFDDLYITKGEFLGDLKFYVIYPDAPGDTNEWTPEGAATAWEATDDHVPDDDSTYAHTDTPARLMVNMEDISQQGEIRAVQTNVIAKKSEAGTAAIQIGNQFNGEEHMLETDFRPNYQTYIDFRLAYRLNPTTLETFTAEDINGMQVITDRSE